MDSSSWCWTPIGCGQGGPALGNLKPRARTNGCSEEKGKRKVLDSACPVSPSKLTSHSKPLLLLGEGRVNNWEDIRSVELLELPPHVRKHLGWRRKVPL